ncbi:hypothetical protein [Salmonella phage FrontPhageNews]|nr:hypothetical protein [Salmonella phage FrontPhageNews]
MKSRNYIMTKTELNNILNVAGYKNILRGNNKIARDRSNKIIKGFPLCKTGPLDISNPSKRLFKDLLRELGTKGLVLDKKDDLVDFGIAVMKIAKFKITLCVQTIQTYDYSEGRDPNYETKYVNVRIEWL